MSELINKAEEIGIEYVNKELEKAIEGVEISKEALIPKQNLIEIVKHANSWIKFVAGEDEDLFKVYRYRVYKEGETLVVVQGKEKDTEPQQGF